MALYDYLLEQYGFNEPILTTEIQYRDYSKPWLYKEINRLVKDGKLMKFDKGIFQRIHRLAKAYLILIKLLKKSISMTEVM